MAKKILARVLALGSMLTTITVFAATSSSEGSGIGGMAARVTESIGNIVKLITAGCYVVGFCLVAAGLLKLKAHKENPQNVPLSQALWLLVVGAGLLFLPSLLNALGITIFGSGMSVGGISGVTSF